MSRVKGLLFGATSPAERSRLPARSASEDGQPAARAAGENASASKRPPSSNTGGTVRSADASGFRRIAEQETISLVLTDSGRVKQLLVRRPANGQCAFIDCLRFTIGEETWCRTAGIGLISDEDFIKEASLRLEQILGFGITRHLNRPSQFYADSWELGDGYGLVCLGGEGQRATMLIVIHGSGCLAAKEGWEQRLHDFLASEASRPKITRVDVAHDCFDGDAVNVEIADRWYDDGGFNCSYRFPSHEYRGNWKNPDGKGRTLYVGNRNNGKYCRVYEKGREQGDATSDWTRVEVEFKSRDRIVPLDILVNPSIYFAGAYPCLSLIAHESSPQRIECKSKSAQINVDACIGHIKRTYGKHLKVLRGIFGDADLLSRVESPSDDWPRRLKVADYRWTDTPIHKLRREPRTFCEFDVSEDENFTAPGYGSSGGLGASSCPFH